MEKVRLTERPENLSSNSEILDWDIYQYYKFLAERGDVQIQVMYTEKAAFLEHANCQRAGSFWVPGGLTVPSLECEREETPSPLCPTPFLSASHLQLWGGLIEEVVATGIARWWWWGVGSLQFFLEISLVKNLGFHYGEIVPLVLVLKWMNSWVSRVGRGQHLCDFSETDHGPIIYEPGCHHTLVSGFWPLRKLYA